MRSETPPVLLDVREQWELQLAALDGAVNIPMALVPERLDELRDLQACADLVVMCHGGRRSETIARFLLQHDFEQVFNLDGGITGWSEQVDQTIPVY
ncbi:MAG: hypothetical protein HKN70_14190 [Gammaproteobacteria bacterium]|nr:hypothetical protein [Gammaproteobacteria bacterium]